MPLSGLFEFGSASGRSGRIKEFEAIHRPVVIGGALPHGGYGSVIGACFGALIFGVVPNGYFLHWYDSDCSEFS